MHLQLLGTLLKYHTHMYTHTHTHTHTHKHAHATYTHTFEFETSYLKTMLSRGCCHVSHVQMHLTHAAIFRLKTKQNSARGLNNDDLNNTLNCNTVTLQ